MLGRNNNLHKIPKPIFFGGGGGWGGLKKKKYCQFYQLLNYPRESLLDAHIIRYIFRVAAHPVYYILPKYSDRQSWPENVDPDQTLQNLASDQEQHSSPLTQQFSEASKR